MDNILLAPPFAEEEQEDGEEPPESPNLQQQLNQFRAQWHQEIQASVQGGDALDPSSGRPQNANNDERIVEEKAKSLFIQGIQAEQEGLLYEAIKFYRRAIQLDPDIEMKIDFRAARSPRERHESESSVDGSGLESEDDVLNNLANLQLNEIGVCQPETSQRTTHISCLPVEVLIYIFKWVVSEELDMRSLEVLAQVCRGFYLCARDEELWKLACQTMWGQKGSSLKKYGSWRKMFIDKPHPQFNGCYISKTSYVRAGEQNLTHFYRPFHLVEYYRYVHFFPEGLMLMLCSPDEPLVSLPKLRYRNAKHQGLLKGYYSISGNKVSGVLRRVKVPEQSVYRYRRQRPPVKQTEEIFCVEFEITTVGRRSFSMLNWAHYSIRSRNRFDHQEVMTQFDLNKKAYPPLIFSRVKSYTSLSDKPLGRNMSNN